MGQSNRKDELSPLFSWRGEVCGSHLAPTQRHVALTLSMHMNERGGSCFPGIDTLAEETGLDARTVQRALRVLADSGWLSVERGGGRGRSNRYTAIVPQRVADDPRISAGVSDSNGGAGAIKGGAGALNPGTDEGLGRQEDDSNSLSVRERVDVALDLLAERDMEGKEPTDPRAYLAACRNRRSRESKIELTKLATKKPDWSPDALADAVDLRNRHEEAKKADPLPDCNHCGNTRWEPDSSPVERCSVCWSEIEEKRSA